jgi:hypothetical protein
MLREELDRLRAEVERLRERAGRLESALRSIADHADGARDLADQGDVPLLSAFLYGVAMQALDAAPGDEKGGE